MRCRQPSSDVAENLDDVSCTECTGHGSDFEFTWTAKMETRVPVGDLVMNFSRPMIVGELWRSEVVIRWKKIKFSRFCRKTTPYGKIFKILFRKDSSRHRSTCCVQMSWNLADGEIGKIARCLPVKKTNFRLALQLSLLRGSRPKYAMASPENLLRVLQISSKSACFRWNYTQTREHHQNGP